MQVGDVVAWNPTRAACYPQKVKFVGIVTSTPYSGKGNVDTHVSVIWMESTSPTLNDIRDLKVLETSNESW